MRFTNIALSDLRNSVAKLKTNNDAIFITKEFFEEQFIIQSMKSLVPFLYSDISYEEAHDVDNLMYVIGFIDKDTNLEKWGYGLFNDIEYETNIREVYSRLFSTIETILEKSQKVGGIAFEEEIHLCRNRYTSADR